MGLLYQADLESNARLQKLRFFPLALTGGAGRRVIDESGRSLLDLSAACFLHQLLSFLRKSLRGFVAL